MLELLSNIAFIEGLNIALGMLYLFVFAPIVHKSESSKYSTNEVWASVICGYAVFCFAVVVCLMVLFKKSRSEYYSAKDRIEAWLNPRFDSIQGKCENLAQVIASFLDKLYRLK